jgi:hypothetical protein
MAVAKLVTPKQTLDVVQEDEPDNQILECAVKAGSDFIISADNDLLRLGKLRWRTDHAGGGFPATPGRTAKQLSETPMTNPANPSQFCFVSLISWRSSPLGIMRQILDSRNQFLHPPRLPPRLRASALIPRFRSRAGREGAETLSKTRRTAVM